MLIVDKDDSQLMDAKVKEEDKEEMNLDLGDVDKDDDKDDDKGDTKDEYNEDNQKDKDEKDSTDDEDDKDDNFKSDLEECKYIQSLLQHIFTLSCSGRESISSTC